MRTSASIAARSAIKGSELAVAFDMFASALRLFVWEASPLDLSQSILATVRCGDGFVEDCLPIDKYLDNRTATKKIAEPITGPNAG
jgi:hypothetical protein